MGVIILLAITSPENARAAFTEAGKVIMHVRCLNCHPNSESPTQRNLQTHEPPVKRDVPVMECQSCHQEKNAPLSRVPGAPKWHLAPREMAWQGKTLTQICEQIKDPKRNGGKTLPQIVEHSAHDELVAWGWAPGADREPAPFTQEKFGALMRIWMEEGAACPLPSK